MFSAKMKDWTLHETPSSRLSVYFDRSQRDRFKRPLHEKKSLSHNLSFSFYYTQVLDDNSHQLVIIMYFATLSSKVNRLVISTGSRMKFPETTSASLDRHFRRHTHDSRTHAKANGSSRQGGSKSRPRERAKSGGIHGGLGGLPL